MGVSMVRVLVDVREHVAASSSVGVASDSRRDVARAAPYQPGSGPRVGTLLGLSHTNPEVSLSIGKGAGVLQFAGWAEHLSAPCWEMDKEPGVWDLLERAPIDWTEPWLIGLVAFHVLCFTITCISFKYYKLQIGFFLLLVGLVGSAEYINEVAASSWRSYSKQQYFDSTGMFISLVFSAPLLCNTIIIVIHWVYKTLSVMTELKTIQNKRKEAKKKREKSE
uniref:Transmembrane protein 18 n=1 Tax=Leptobrachium leishanense TaxID=445787 RepID=A0A8C5QM36_9ANUR